MTAIDTALDQPFIVELEEFSGPLDLLLHLIREQELDIADIPIAQVADQFLVAIGGLGVNEAADYLDMAVRLLRIKIQMLLPRPFDDDAWEDPRAELVRRLLEYEQVREVSGWLTGQAKQQAERFPRGWMPPDPVLPPRPIVIELSNLIEAVERVVESMPQPIVHRVVARPLDVEGAMSRLKQVLTKRSKISFSKLLGTRPAITDVLSHLIALLELARTGFVRIMQSKPFRDFSIRRAKTDKAA